VIRTGAGPKRAAAAAERLSGGAGPPATTSSAPPAPTAAPTGPGPAVKPNRVVAVAGVGGALVADLRPGDLLVADRVLRADGTTVRRLPSATILAGALRRRGLRVHLGPVISTERMVHGAAARRALADHGALVVDMESAALAASLPPGPFAVVRAVADTPTRELFSPATVTGGLAALRALRAAAPVLEAWAAAAGPRRVLLAEPRSFCAGVERAIHTVERALERYGAPIYVRRQIVHNRHVVAGLEERGAVFVDELHQVPERATVVYSAHGVGRTVRAEAAARQLQVIDATCPLVAKVHSEVRRFAASGRQVVLVGHSGHDEIEGTLDQTDGVLLIERREDVASLEAGDSSRVAYTTQTTLSPEDVDEVVSALRTRWPDITGPPAADICYATHNRQRAVAAVAQRCDLVLVVGSTNSSNSHRLVEVAARAGACAKLIDDASELDPTWLVGTDSVGVTAGASAPEELVTRVLEALAGLGSTEVETTQITTESVSFSLPLEVR
jgi:4-hydroxy-3-methylbut-2-en-1-yl diphosphate reductase